jgi:hypothetical protein
MSEDLQVKITADIGQFVQGLTQATSKIEDAVKAMSSNIDKLGTSSRAAQGSHEGLTGSIQSSIREYAAGAAAGLSVAKAIEKITEFAKESVKWVYDSAEAVNSWAEQFKELRVTTGESLDSLNKIYAATLQSGQGGELVSSLMMGWTRGIKANADALVANGVAADKASLMAMPFQEYLTKVYEISTEMKSPAEANVFLTEALGRSGALAAPKLKELVENLKENNSAMATGNLITQTRIDMQERDEKATGNLKIAYQKTYATLGDSMNSVLAPLKEMAGGLLGMRVAEDDVQKAMEAGIVTTDHWYSTLSTVEAKLKTTLEYFRQLAIAATEAAKDSWDVGTGDAASKNRTLQAAPGKTGKPVKTGKAPAATGDGGEAVSLLEEQQWEEDYRKKRQAEDQKAWDKEAAGNRHMLEMELDDEKKAAEEQKKIAKQIQTTWEQNTVKGGMASYLRETKEAMAQWGSYIKTMLQGIEGAFSSTFKGILTGQMSIGQALTNLWQGLRDAVMGMIAEMLAKWVTSKLLEMIMGKTAATSEASAGAAAYAVAAMQSVAAIPMVGWAMAPGVGAAAYATGMGYAALASAAGGWGNVPSDQLAMIHKNEMVLPANLAEGARQTFAGGGGTEIHIHTVDAHSFEAMLLRNQGALLKVTNTVVRNGRKS